MLCMCIFNLFIIILVKFKNRGQISYLSWQGEENVNNHWMGAESPINNLAEKPPHLLFIYIYFFFYWFYFSGDT